MKSMIIAATAVAALAAGVTPALAQSTSPVSYYGSIGDTYLTKNGSLNEITGRVGARWGQYLGVEGEIGGGVSSMSGPGYKASEPLAGALYGVVFYPLMPNLDVLARVGYGESNFHNTYAATPRLNGSQTTTSVNYGVGAQYFLTANDGVRGDYTKRDYMHHGAPYDADAWSLSYVRKF